MPSASGEPASGGYPHIEAANTTFPPLLNKQSVDACDGRAPLARWEATFSKGNGDIPWVGKSLAATKTAALKFNLIRGKLPCKEMADA
jgi:hypothetical protein